MAPAFGVVSAFLAFGAFVVVDAFVGVVVLVFFIVSLTFAAPARGHHTNNVEAACQRLVGVGGYDFRMPGKRVEAKWAFEDDLNENRRSVRFALDSRQFRREVDAALWTACLKAKLKGFRRGKVPLDVGRRLWGRDAVSKVVDDLVSRFAEEALKDPRILSGACGPPVLAEPPELSDSGLSWTLTLPLEPRPVPGTFVDFGKPAGGKA